MVNQKKPRLRKRCPKCGSTDISLYLGAQLGMVYHCKNCGYRGPLVVEEDVTN